jgi:hypothetical protein
MLHRVSSITATVAAIGALAGCSAAGDRSPAAVTVQADTTSPQCSHGGGHQPAPLAVTLVSFDTRSLSLFAVDASGTLVSTQVTQTTSEIPADLDLFPPDPIYPQCTNDASMYDDALGDGLTRGLLDSIAGLANDGCDATLTLAPDGTIASIQPTP